MIFAAQPHAFPLRRFTRMPSARRERSRQSVSPLLSSLCERVMASTRCMQLAALAAVALLAAEAWGVSNALATRGACPSQGVPCELSCTTPCVEVRTPLLPPGERLTYTSQAKTLRNAPARNLLSMCRDHFSQRPAGPLQHFSTPGDWSS